MVKEESESPYIEGQNISLVCQGNVGKPAGQLTWSVHRTTDDTFQELPENFVESHLVSHMNGTRSVVSQLRMVVSEDDDGAVYKCIASSDIMDAYEYRPFAQTTLIVQCKYHNDLKLQYQGV